MSKRVLLLAATTGYQTRLFAETAQAIGFQPVLATDRCHVLEDPWGDSALPVRFQDPDSAAAIAAELNPRPDGIVAIGDRPAETAARIAEHLGLPFHPASAVATCRNKFKAREKFRQAGLPTPEYFRTATHIELGEVMRLATYPCVLKPLGLSASRGVIRANDQWEFADAFERICSLLEEADIRRLNDDEDRYIQVETYIPGREFAIEGLMSRGEMKALAIFDKPDPLEGPYFEETIYVTPSRESPVVQQLLVETTRKAAAAVGLTDGPLHAEMRYSGNDVYMLEIAARPIGGLCAKSLRFGDGMPLEELILRHAVGQDVSSINRESAASGVMMIPIPQNGIYCSAGGVEDARAVQHIQDVIITAKEGQRLRKLPEGASYLGFLFASAGDPGEVETALRRAHQQLRFEIAAELAVLRS